MELPPVHRTVILGRSGSGKTTLGRALAIDAGVRLRVPVVCVSPVTKEPPFFDVETLAAQMEADESAGQVRRYEFLPVGERSHLELVEWAAQSGNMVLMLDELGEYCSPASIEPEFRKAFALTRHIPLYIIGVGLRPADINRRVTSSAERVIAFSSVEPLDVKYLESRGFPIGRLPALPPYHALMLETGTGSVTEIFLSGSRLHVQGVS